MIRADERNRGVGLALLAVLLVGCCPLCARAETLTFRNECDAAVVVQLASVHRGVFCRDRPYLLRPGDATTPGIVLPGDKVITVYDAKVPNRVLYQGCPLCRRSWIAIIAFSPTYPRRACGCKCKRLASPDRPRSNRADPLVFAFPSCTAPVE